MYTRGSGGGITGRLSGEVTVTGHAWAHLSGLATTAGAPAGAAKFDMSEARRCKLKRDRETRPRVYGGTRMTPCPP